MKIQEYLGQQIFLIAPFCKTKGGDEANDFLEIQWALRISFSKIMIFIQPIAQITCLCILLSTVTPGSPAALETRNGRDICNFSLVWSLLLLSEPVNLISSTNIEQDWKNICQTAIACSLCNTKMKSRNNTNWRDQSLNKYRYFFPDQWAYHWIVRGFH